MVSESRIFKRRTARIGLVLMAVCAFGTARSFEVSGKAGFEARIFKHDPHFAEQTRGQFSVFAQPEFYREWDNGRQSVLFVPFARLDSVDPRRSHADVREGFWQIIGEDWELRLGAAKVFWGVTESQHLVDVINQTDAIEDIDGEDKLGQPMVDGALIRDWGTVNLFLMPWFRERSFPGTRGRLRPAIRIADDDSDYESRFGRLHPDVALRWSHVLGDWDVGLAHFYGHNREPEFKLEANAKRFELVPQYNLIHQTSVDLQLTLDAWLWKFEAIRRIGQGKPFIAATTGFEYTFFGILDSAADLGVIGEYLYDQRDERATTPFQDDVFAGVRLALNDEQSMEVLAGVIIDPQHGSRIFSIEASRRFGDAWKVELNARFWSNTASRDPLAVFQDDDHAQLSIMRFF